MSRASRTDKGVHAAMNVLVCKVQFQENDLIDPTLKFADFENKSSLKPLIDREKVIQKWNELAPDDIRFYGNIIFR